MLDLLPVGVSASQISGCSSPFLIVELNLGTDSF